MKLRVEQLSAALKKGLSPLYLISGDEPLQVGEACDAVRAACRAAGYSEREVLEVDKGFDWNALMMAANSLSLFADRRLIELRLPSGKPGIEGSKALVEYALRAGADTVLLIISGRLDGAAQKSKWYKSVDSAGVTLPVWPVDPPQLPGWIRARLRARGLSADGDAAELLAQRVEGNLLAAAQEIEKLCLLHPQGSLNVDQVLEVVANSARYDVFGLLESALVGDAERTLRQLEGLRQEGTVPMQILGLLAFELRRLATLATEVGGRPVSEDLFRRHRIFGNPRRQAIGKALRRHGPRSWSALLGLCGRIDRQVKGQLPGEPWETLTELLLVLAEAPGKTFKLALSPPISP